MSIDPARPGRSFQAIRIQLRPLPGANGADTQRERALSLIAAALLAIPNGTSLAWTIQTVSVALLIYDITPLPGQSPQHEHLAAMLAVLRSQPEVAAATLVFAHSG
jgi:hypothetical protein